MVRHSRRAAIEETRESTGERLRCAEGKKKARIGDGGRNGEQAQLRAVAAATFGGCVVSCWQLGDVCDQGDCAAMGVGSSTQNVLFVGTEQERR